MPRRFNHGQHVTLYLVGDGRCARCGDELPANWHADHRHPFARGGATDIANGQALCPACNLHKGATVEGISVWPGDRPLRLWQTDARTRWVHHGSADFLLVATPGGGKTQAALRIVSEQLLAGHVDRVVVIVPTDHLRRQWANHAAAVGLQLNPDWENAGPDGPGMCGICVTFHQVARAPDVHALLCRKARTLVIIDEVHHAATTRAWGDALRAAYGGAWKRLLLSGTLFRSDSLAIPFVSYVDGRSVADFTYTYGQALGEEVVRAIHFPNYEGDLTWRYRDQVIRAAFRDAIPEDQARRRLRTALDPAGEWLPAIIRQADEQLSTVRLGGHSRAGGLIVCVDMWHARRVGDLVARIAGEAPTIVVSDDPDASDKISAFERGGQRWLVAVRMVSEGVDVPRLRVGIYATNIISELYFRQLVGRFVRVVPGIGAAEQAAWLYLPADETLVSYAYTIKSERDHQLNELQQQETRLREAAATDDGKTTGLFTPLSANDAELVDVIVGEDRFTAGDLEVARGVRLQADLTSLSDAQVARVLRIAGRLPAAEATVTAAREEQAQQQTPIYLLRRNLRNQCVRLVNRLVAQTGADQQTINRWLASATGAYVNEASIEQLEQRRDLLLIELERKRDGTQSARG